MKKLVPEQKPHGHNDGLGPMWSVLVPIVMILAFITMVAIGASLAH